MQLQIVRSGDEYSEIEWGEYVPTEVSSDDYQHIVLHICEMYDLNPTAPNRIRGRHVETRMCMMH